MSTCCEHCGAVREKVVTWGPLAAGDAPYLVTHNGRVLKMRPGTARVMYELVKNGKVSRDRICNVSTHEASSESYVQVMIWNLRRELREAGVDDVKIAPLKGFGYRLQLAA